MAAKPRAVVEVWLTHLAIERGVSANTLSNYTRDLRRYLDYLESLGREDLGAVTSQDLEGYLRALRAGDPQKGLRPLAASSSGRALVVVRGLHKFALAEGLIPVDVAAEVSPPKTARDLPDTLRIDEVARLIDSIPVDDAATPQDLRDAALVEFLYATGVRVSECTGLMLDSLPEIRDGLVRIVGKGNKARVVPVGSKAIEAVDRYVVRGRPALATGKSHALFLNRRGGALSRQSVWQVLKNRAAGAGISQEISPHTLRHSFATHLMEGGANVRVVQELLGHSSVTTTQIYTHVTADNLRQVWATSHPRA